MTDAEPEVAQSGRDTTDEATRAMAWSELDEDKKAWMPKHDIAILAYLVRSFAQVSEWDPFKGVCEAAKVILEAGGARQRRESGVVRLEACECCRGPCGFMWVDKASELPFSHLLFVSINPMQCCPIITINAHENAFSTTVTLFHTGDASKLRGNWTPLNEHCHLAKRRTSHM